MLHYLSAAAKAAESELKEIASKNPSAPSKKEDSAKGKGVSPLEQKVDQMKGQLYVSYFTLQEKTFDTNKPSRISG